MLPRQLVAENFAGYPAEAKRLASNQVGLLRQLPLAFVPLLLRELIVYDWKFPAERKNIDRQFAYLTSLSPGQLAKEMEPFSQLQLAASLEKTDWVNSPSTFSEQLTAHLWNTHQIDLFRKAAIVYVGNSSAMLPDEPLPTHRLGIIIIGRGVANNEYRLFRKLRPQGTYFTHVRHENGLAVLTSLVARRAASYPTPYSHWYIDGGASVAKPEGVTLVSYAALSTVRGTLQSRMRKNFEASVFDPEAFRTKLAQTRPEEVGFADTADESVLNRFQLSLLTEGSGTQVFATTFVQWAAREALRRAQPLTLLARFAPRQRENSMNELLAETQRRPDLDAAGSLVDADMGAYYTWLNQQRLPGAAQSRFLVWFEDHQEAVAIGPALERGRQYDDPVELLDVVKRVA